MTAAREPYYVTTPIYYVNDVPHIGHVYTTVVADSLARYHRAVGRDVRFLTGTDEHGQKIERAARAQGLAPIALADRVVGRYHELWKRLSVAPDDFIRTTQPRHRETVHALIERMRAAGDIELGSYEGWYCSGCEAFYPESQLVGGKCPEQGHPVERLAETSYFFRLSRYQEPLLELYRSRPDFIRPASRRNEVVAFVEGGLKDLSVSRTSLRWGIPWPGDPDHVVYVWLDALSNYVSALGYGTGDATLYDRYWPARVHLIGKDILRFHAVYWPAFLMSAGLPLPECVFAHGWWLKDDAKMSKSAGNVVRPGELIDVFGPDGLRWFLLREMTFGLDGSYSDEQLLDRYNGDLANGIGNLTSRILALVGGSLPAPSARPEAGELEAAAAEAHAAWRRGFESFELSSALAAISKLSGELDRYLVRHAPWALAKDPERKEEHRAVLRGAAEALLQIAALSSPVMPEASAEIASRLSASLPSDLSRFRWGLLPPAGEVRRGEPLFARVDKAAYFSQETKPVEDTKITIDEFLKVELRVAKVLEAEKVEGADKLLRLQVDLGGETRQIVAGIAKAYAPESLVGKSIVVVANLKPAKLRGIESQGMLLAADLGGKPIVATFEEEVPPGTRVR